MGKSLILSGGVERHTDRHALRWDIAVGANVDVAGIGVEISMQVRGKGAHKQAQGLHLTALTGVSARFDDLCPYSYKQEVIV